MPLAPLGWYCEVITRIWFRAASIHLDMSLCRDSEYVPLNIDIVLSQVNTFLNMITRLLG